MSALTGPDAADPDRGAGIEAAHVAPPVVVKKYANRRLYNTETSSYITLDNLAEMVRTERDFVVYDAKSGDDITRSVLTQIIVEEEGRGRAMLPTGFLRHLINFYGGNMDHGLPGYLERSMEAFARQQSQMRRAMQQMGMVFPFNLEEVGRQNLAMMERAMTLFTAGGTGGREGLVTQDVSEVAPERQAEMQLEQLRVELEALRSQLAHTQAAAAAQARATAADATGPAPDRAPDRAPDGARDGETDAHALTNPDSQLG